MSVLERTDAKAGYSTICRRGEHKTCAMAKARCTCSCHGRNGQAPPQPPEKPMSEATVTALPSKPAAEHECIECDRTFVSAQGLALHRTRTHGPKRSAPSPKAAPKPSAVEPADQWQLLAIVAEAYASGLEVTIAEAIDGARTIISGIENAGWRVIEA